MNHSYLSIDIGGTNIKYGLLDKAGNLREHHKITTSATNLNEFKATIQGVISQYADQIRGISFSVPGKVDTTTGTVYHGGSLPFLGHVNFRKIFATPNHLPIAVENDGKAAALAELWLGNLKGINSGVAIVLGTGVGGGIIIDGHLLRGRHLQAGELSFMINSDHHPLNQDCLAGFNQSAVAMVTQIGQALHLKNPNDGKRVFEFINSHNEIAWPLFQSYTRGIAKLILTLQGVLDVDRFVIGGGISAQPIVTQEIQHALQMLFEENTMLRAYLTNFDVQSARFANDANLYGALYSFLDQIDKGALK